ncbi:MAG: DUF4836 family protein [Bacteroidaceae bacterium]|nr:DUF4836 family protein [Bacteroidaceae bacterium]
MKKFHLIAAVVLAVLALSSCTNTDYKNVIPANAPLVMEVDIRSIAEKSEFQQSKGMQELEKSLSAVVAAKDMEKVKGYIEDPMSMGIDFSMPVYAFMVDMQTLGLTMKVDDEDAVKDFLLLLNKQGMASKPQEKNNLICGTLLDDVSYTYDGTTFLLLASLEKSGGAKMSKLAQRLMDQKREDSFFYVKDVWKTELYGPVKCYACGGNLPKEVMTPLLELFPKNIKPSDVDVVADLNFEKGTATLTTALIAKTDEAQKLIDEANENMSKIEGRYLDKVSDNAVIWMGAGVKGKWLLEKIKANKTLNGLLFASERAVDAGQMLQAIDGDVSLELSASEVNPNDVEYMMYAKLDNSKFLADVNDWKQSHKEFGIDMKDKGNNQYLLTLDGQTYEWGVQDDDLYWGTVQAFNHSKESTGAFLRPYEKAIKKSQVFFILDLDALGREAGMSTVGLASQVYGHYLHINRIIVQSWSANGMALTIVQENQDENFLKQILQ